MSEENKTLELNDEDLEQVNGGTGEGGCTGNVSYHKCRINPLMMDPMSPGLYSGSQNLSVVVHVDEDNACGGFSYYPVSVEFDSLTSSWKETRLSSNTQKYHNENAFYSAYPYKVTLS